MGADWRQQEELEQERISRSLAILERVRDAGLEYEAEILASELGLFTYYRRFVCNGKTQGAETSSNLPLELTSPDA